MADVFRLDDKVVCVLDEKEAELIRCVIGRLYTEGTGPDNQWKSHDLFEKLKGVGVERTLDFSGYPNAKAFKTTLSD